MSKFTVADLQSLRSVHRSYKSPLAVIAHIDMNAFFAQIEQLKHGFSREDPVICVQWKSIIAVSYTARKYGISRLDTLDSAIKKCPHVIPLHTAVFRKGENFWRNVNSCLPEEFPSPATHKVCLDPYRRESRKILRIFREMCKNVEKASVDESFFDLGHEVYEMAIDTFPELKEAVKLPGDTNLPKFVHWPEDIELKGYVVPVEGEDSDQQQIDDWDDVMIFLGSVITHRVRQKVESSLGYTTSCGIARCKTLAKLGSGFKKPDNQTIIRNSTINSFLRNFAIDEFWGLGGKAGKQVIFDLHVPVEKEKSISYIRDNFTLDELTEKLEDAELATKVYKIVRGELFQPLAEKKETSMCSSKRFRDDSGSTREDCVEWLRVFAGDLTQRIREINEEEFNGTKSRCPRSLSLHYSPRNSNQFRSKQMGIPLVPIEETENCLFENGVKLLDEVSREKNIFPLFIMDLTVGKFETVSGMGFLEGFFGKGKGKEEQEGEKGEEIKKASEEVVGIEVEKMETEAEVVSEDVVKSKEKVEDEEVTKKLEEPVGPKDYHCSECNTIIPQATSQVVGEHQDFHFAVNYSTKLNGEKATKTVMTGDPDVIDLTVDSETVTEELNIITPKIEKDVKVENVKAKKAEKRGKAKSSKESKKRRTDKYQSVLPF